MGSTSLGYYGGHDLEVSEEDEALIRVGLNGQWHAPLQVQWHIHVVQMV